MAEEDRRFGKGFFGPRRLPVAGGYVREPGRKRLFIGGAVAAVLLTMAFAGDAFLGSGGTTTRGPLAASHALFGSECSTCHVPMEGVPDAKCESCHQQFGTALGVYSLDRHYIYRSGQVDRSAPSTREPACADCHREHQGRTEPLTRVADTQCVGCHEVDSFEDDHPEFQFAAEGLSDPTNLHFPHALHVLELMAEHELVDAEAACLRCHTPEPGGEGFQPLDFERHCDGCHLGSSASTPLLPTGGSGPRVATLGEIRARGGPGAHWADFWNPNELSQRAGAVQKRPVYHKDPWILHNLRKLRREMYPGAELSDLLRSSADVRPGQSRRLYEEAIATLRAQIEALRGEPSREVQRELSELTALLQELERRVERPFEPLDETRFAVGTADRAEALESGAMDEEAYLAVVDSLTQPCQTCHLVDRATLRRVGADQKLLVRARFEHRAHVVHARCLDCHATIPIRDALIAGEELPPEQDRAQIVNLPGVESCRSCHGGRKAPAQCTTCHLFHPDKSHWTNLTR